MRTRLLTHRQAMTLPEVLITMLAVLAIVAVVGAFILPNLARPHRRTSRTVCISKLKQIGLAARIYANDHDEKFPWEMPAVNGGTLHLVNSPDVFQHFTVMSNELTTPKLLFCPDDRRVSPVDDFAKLQNANLSYFVGISSTMTNAIALLAGDRNVTGGTLSNGFMRTFTSNSAAGWTKEIHHDVGNVALADGSVQQLTSIGLSNHISRVLESTPVVRLALP